jgi:hypothetical protein
VSKWVMRAHFKHLEFSNDIKNSLIQWVLTPLKSLFKDSKVH